MSPEVYARSLCLAGQGAIAVVSARFFCYRNKILTRQGQVHVELCSSSRCLMSIGWGTTLKGERRSG